MSMNEIRILLATDNHIGYLENDPIRKDDSFRAFEEVLQLAHQENADFILLGGDLFHDNKPSRNCLHRTMELMRKYCFGDRPCEVWIASDQDQNFGKDITANYLDPNVNIGMPIFSIHGNHDEPQGGLCALQVLSSAKLVNYFGMSNSVEDVTVKPILMQKGSTKLALYGLGNIRDERLHRLWRSGKVTFMRPLDEEGVNSWNHCFNLFVLHQNRSPHGRTSHIPEDYLDDFIDLVIWGHEHECRIRPEGLPHVQISQPGSSVATSLCEGEAQEKHVGLLAIRGDDYHLKPLRLKTPRPLEFTTIVLSSVPTLNIADEKSVNKYLESVAEDLIDRANSKWEDQQQHTQTEYPLPLIRIRVEYMSGYSASSPKQFGQKFVGRVANPEDMLKFQKEKLPGKQKKMKASEVLMDTTTVIPEKLSTITIFDLVHEMLPRHMTVVSRGGLLNAITLSMKGDKGSIKNLVRNSIIHARTRVNIPEDIDYLTVEYVKGKITEGEEREIPIRPLSTDSQPIINSVPIQSEHGDTGNDSNVFNLSDDDMIIPTYSSPSTQQSAEPTRTSTRGRARTSTLTEPIVNRGRKRRLPRS
ncbi:Metallo-dependent phosphatase-like protein [Pilobolus umbonatus]|nr:Metallo-dependent phosphatase-like protein [Pilobolus umbonatus]